MKKVVNIAYCACVQILQKYYLHSLSYNNLYLAHKYDLTLSCLQVRCDGTFSKLIYILNRLRNYLGQSELVTYLLMSINIFVRIDDETIIDTVSQQSRLMSNLLKLINIVLVGSLFINIGV